MMQPLGKAGTSGVGESTLRVMREDWNKRAVENAEHYIQNANEKWDEREFFRSGEINVANEIMPDMHSICGGTRSPRDLSMLEIGCGVGRMTKFIARIFGHVTGVDVSSEMIVRAAANLASLDNVTLVTGDGATLSAVPDASQDFAFSFIVFQHIPSADVITSYCREVRRVLRPGALFKFQLQGAQWQRDQPPDTWHGVSFSEDDARQLCRDSGFLLERSEGATTQFYWLWFRKPG
jgi:ubiquinone/menaquinone biosynthesis C-methylase UbiE